MTFDSHPLAAMSQDDYFIAPGLQSAPLTNFRTVDAGVAAESVSKVFFPHDIHVRDYRSGLSFRHSSAALNAVTFNQITYGNDVDIVINGLNRSHYVFVLPLRGGMDVEARGGSFRLEVGSCMLMSPEAPYAFMHREDDAHLAVGVPRRLLEMGEGLCQSRLMRGLDPENIGDHTQAIVDYLGFVCGEFHRGGGLMHSRAVSSSLESALIAMFQTLVASDIRSAGSLTSAVPGFVYRAERYIANHLLDDITLEDIIAASGVPQRTLYHAFRQFRGSTPLKALRSRRLEMIRCEILAGAAEGVQVTEIANKYWMSHPGRFAAYYQQQFNETPSTSLRAARTRLRQESATGRRLLLSSRIDESGLSAFGNVDR